MKAKTIILALLMTFGVFSSRAYDFSAVAPSGQTLYYNIRTDGTGVNVVWPNASTTLNSETWTGYTKPTGDLTIPSSVTYEGTTYSVVSIGTAFYQCTGLTSVTIPNTVTKIANSAFSRCTGLTGNLTIPNSVTTIGRNAFYYCRGITSLSISNSLTTIDTSLFFACTGLTSVVVPSSVKHIKAFAFDSCVNLNSITLGDSVQDVGWRAFAYCRNLSSITIPSTVTSIGGGCFYYCSNLNHIYMKPETPPSLENSSFSCTPSTKTFYVSCNAYTAYYNSSVWNIYNLLATFPYNFSVTADPAGGTVEILREPTCDNAQAEVQANPYTGFHFTNWSDGNTNAHRYIVVTHDTAIYANFAEDVTYTVTATSANTSMGSVSGGGTYTEGSSATLSATAYNGYHFSHWQDNNTSNPRTITVTGNATYTAYFEANAPTQYTITVNSANSSMGSASGGGTYNQGSSVSISATPNSGYRFVHWQDNNTANPRVITVSANATYTAYFESIGENPSNQYTISVQSSDPAMGSVTGSGTFASGTTTTITATPYSGYVFVQWQDGNTDRIRTITVTGDATYTAYFDYSNGINDVESADNIKIYTRGNSIVIDFSRQQAADSRQSVVVYDIMGRVIKLAAGSGRQTAVEIPVTSAGVYMVKVGDQPSRKVLVRP